MAEPGERAVESELHENCEESELFSTSTDDIGRISLSFIDAEPSDYPEYPNSYYTFSAKERLLLIYAENVRRQFIAQQPDSARLVLAIPNECAIQKFVCTTIRPTVLLYPELLDSWSAIAQFIADFVVYQPLDAPTELVSLGKSEKAVTPLNESMKT